MPDDITSIVAADFGSVNTRVVLIDLVDGAYRLVARSSARTTGDDSLRDVSVGLYRALRQMSEQTGRRLLQGPKMASMLRPEQGDGNGFDAFLATSSNGRPLRVVVVGLMPDVSITSALKVLSWSYVEVVDTLSLADIRSEQQQINAILAKQPDLIFIVGGTDAGAEEPILRLVRTVRDAVRISGQDNLMVLYAGNRSVQEQVKALLGTGVRLFVADNVRPSLLDERLASAHMELSAIFDRLRAGVAGGYLEISRESSLGVLPTAQSYVNVVRYLGQVLERRKSGEAAGVLVVDVGSSMTTVAASFHKRPTMAIHKNLGVGHSAGGTLEATSLDDIRGWLTWDATDNEITDYIHNKTLRPATVPQTQSELELEYALAREAIRVAVTRARKGWALGKHDRIPELRPLIGSGAVLTNAPHAGVAALLLLDAIQPSGVTEIWLDPAGLIPALGALAYLNPGAVVQMLDAGDVLMVGSAVCADGTARIGKGGLKIKIKLPDGRVEKHRVPGGTIWTYPLAPGQTAQVEVSASRGMTIGGKSRIKQTMTGGVSGLVFDARGRPLPMPSKESGRAKLYVSWLEGMRAQYRTPEAAAKDFVPKQPRANAFDASAAPDDLPETGSLPSLDFLPPSPDEKKSSGWRLFGRRKQADVPEPELVPEPMPDFITAMNLSNAVPVPAPEPEPDFGYDAEIDVDALLAPTPESEPAFDFRVESEPAASKPVFEADFDLPVDFGAEPFDFEPDLGIGSEPLPVPPEDVLSDPDDFLFGDLVSKPDDKPDEEEEEDGSLSDIMRRRLFGSEPGEVLDSEPKAVESDPMDDLRSDLDKKPGKKRRFLR